MTKHPPIACSQNTAAITLVDIQINAFPFLNTGPEPFQHSLLIHAVIVDTEESSEVPRSRQLQAVKVRLHTPTDTSSIFFTTNLAVHLQAPEADGSTASFFHRPASGAVVLHQQRRRYVKICPKEFPAASI